MELGVDISALNAVYLRNVPPTPAKYAQRSGRAGRSGQAALVITYCSAQGPHDQYYFNRPVAMVRGIVRPPALELANRDLVEGHLHAVWLAEAGAELAVDIPHILDLQNSELPVRSEISDLLRRPDLRVTAASTMRRILDSIDAELTPVSAPWATDRDGFALATAASSFSRFSGAFDRWRQLYSGARAQLIEANKRSEMHGLSAVERKKQKYNSSKRTSRSPCWSGELRAIARTSFRIAISPRKASCRATIFPVCPSMLSCPPEDIRPRRRHICNDPAFSRLRNLARAV
jgi:hypothetical protein